MTSRPINLDCWTVSREAESAESLLEQQKTHLHMAEALQTHQTLKASYKQVP